MTIATGRSDRMFESLVGSDALFLDPAMASNTRYVPGGAPPRDEDHQQTTEPDSSGDRSSGAAQARHSSSTEGGDAQTRGEQQYEAGGQTRAGGQQTENNGNGDAGGTGAGHTDGGGTGGDGGRLGGLLGTLGDGQGGGHDSNLLRDVVSTVLQANGAHGSGDVLNNILHHTGSLDIGPNGLLAPEAGTLNSLINEIHLVMENLGHRFDVNDIIHAITDLGSSTGLGNIGVPGPNGQSDFFTDVLSLPNDVLHCGNPVTDIGHIVSDIGTIVGNGHIDHVKDGIFDDLPNPLISADWSSDNQDYPSVIWWISISASKRTTA
jgi:hypothetical protein